MVGPLRLITIPFSHFSEKARWALEHAGVPFVEEAHAPFFHRRATRAVGGRTVPVLVADESVLADSTAILQFADRRAPPERRLYPTDVAEEALALEEHFDAKLGPHTRRVAYHHVLPHTTMVVRLFARDVPRWQARILRVGLPLARVIIRRGYRIDEAGAKRSQQRVDAILAEVDARLVDGRRFLTGAQFTAADLTFAALLAPLVLPPEHPHPLPEDLAPPTFLALRDRLRKTGAGAFAMRLYREHRRRGVPAVPPT